MSKVPKDTMAWAEAVSRRNVKIKALERKVSRLQELLADAGDWKRRPGREMSDEENNGLPVPRLEIRLIVTATYEHTFEYNLVTRHFCDHIQVTPMGTTQSKGGPYQTAEQACESLPLPFRDGAHIVHDKEALGLPGYVVYGKKNRLIEAKTPHERV